MDSQNYPITTLIPQRPPFVMVDCVLSCEDADAVTQFTVRPDNILLDGDFLSASGIIENMAQSCAARMGCVNRLSNLPGVNRLSNLPGKIGTIGDIKDCEILRYPRCHEVLKTYVHIVINMHPLIMASVETRIDDEVIATARIKLAMTELESFDDIQGQ